MTSGDVLSKKESFINLNVYNIDNGKGERTDLALLV